MTDERSELIREIRKLAEVKGLEPQVATFRLGGMIVEPRGLWFILLTNPAVIQSVLLVRR